MHLFDLFERNLPAIKQIGIRAMADAKRDGVPAFYMDQALGTGIVREWPDGTREQVERRNGEIVVMETYARRG